MFATFHKSPMSMFCFGMGGKTFVKTLSVLVCRLLEHLLCGCTHIQLYLSGTFVTQVYLSGTFVTQVYLSGPFVTQVYLSGPFVTQVYLSGPRQVCTTMCDENFMNDLMSS